MSKTMGRLLFGGLIVFLALNAEATKPLKGQYYANATQYTLDPKLPEPFSRTTAAQVVVNFDYQDLSLIFAMSDSEGIEVTFPIISDITDQCNNRVIVAMPPEGSTPYYKDFEIKVIDYSENTCSDLKVDAPTVATLKSYEVRHKSTTQSTILAEALKVVPKDGFERVSE